MKINRANDQRIELYLSDEEIESLFGSYELIDYNIPECRIKIHSLLISAATDELFPLDCKRLLIEVKPKDYGCTISLTKVYDTAKKYRQIKRNKTIVCIFENSDNMLASITALTALNAQNSELYTNKNQYAIIAETKYINYDDTVLLREYCKIKKREIDAVRIREYWRPVCTENAIENLAKAF